MIVLPWMWLQAARKTGLFEADCRAVLETVLRDLPEPSIDAAEYRRLWGLCQDSRLAACQRAEAAEAQLAAVEAKFADAPPPPWLPEELSKALLRAGAAEDKLQRVQALLDQSQARYVLRDEVRAALTGGTHAD